MEASSPGVKRVHAPGGCPEIARGCRERRAATLIPCISTGWAGLWGLPFVLLRIHSFTWKWILSVFVSVLNKGAK